jgi:hypothetical protein
MYEVVTASPKKAGHGTVRRLSLGELELFSYLIRDNPRGTLMRKNRAARQNRSLREMASAYGQNVKTVAGLYGQAGKAAGKAAYRFGEMNVQGMQAAFEVMQNDPEFMNWLATQPVQIGAAAPTGVGEVAVAGEAAIVLYRTWQRKKARDAAKIAKKNWSLWGTPAPVVDGPPPAYIGAWNNEGRGKYTWTSPTGRHYEIELMFDATWLVIDGKAERVGSVEEGIARARAARKNPRFKRNPFDHDEQGRKVELKTVNFSWGQTMEFARYVDAVGKNWYYADPKTNELFSVKDLTDASMKKLFADIKRVRERRGIFPEPAPQLPAWLEGPSQAAPTLNFPLRLQMRGPGPDKFADAAPWNNFIETIKLIRTLTGWGLKESKTICEDSLRIGKSLFVLPSTSNIPSLPPLTYAIRVREDWRRAWDIILPGEILGQGELVSVLALLMQIRKTWGEGLVVETATVMRSNSGRVEYSRRPKTRRVRPNPAKAHEALLRGLITLRLAYQNSHWNAEDYGRHLLFERLLKSLDEDIDTWAELLLADGEKLERSAMFPVTTGLSLGALEKEIDLVIQGLLERETGLALPKEYENFLLNAAEHGTRRRYLLRQAGGKHV